MLSNDASLENITSQLEFLLPYVLRYKLESVADIFKVIDGINQSEFGELQLVADRIKADRLSEAIDTHLKSFSMEQHDGSIWLYFFLGLLDHLGLDFS